MSEFVRLTPKKVVVHELIVLDRDHLVRLCTLFGRDILYWYDGVLLSVNTLDQNDEIIKKRVSGEEEHFIRIYAAPMLKFDEELKDSKNMRVSVIEASWTRITRLIDWIKTQPEWKD